MILLRSLPIYSRAMLIFFLNYFYRQATYAVIYINFQIFLLSHWLKSYERHWRIQLNLVIIKIVIDIFVCDCINNGVFNDVRLFFCLNIADTFYHDATIHMLTMTETWIQRRKWMSEVIADTAFHIKSNKCVSRATPNWKPFNSS